MAARKVLDRQPGAAPEIKHEGDVLTMYLDVAGAPDNIKLVLRCVGDDIYVSLVNQSHDACRDGNG